MEGCRSLIRNILTDDKRLAGSKICLNLLLVKVQAVLVVERDLLALDHLCLKGCQTLLVTEAVICLPLLNQLFSIFHVNAGLHTLALYIRTVSAVLVRSLIVYKSRLLQRAVDNLHSALHIALLIGILNAKHEISSGMLCN